MYDYGAHQLVTIWKRSSTLDCWPPVLSCWDVCREHQQTDEQALDKAKRDELGPFTSYDHMYKCIGATHLGDAPQKCFTVGYAGDIGPDDPFWKSAEDEVWYHDPKVIMSQMLNNPDFHGQYDYMPYIGLDKTGKCHWSNFPSGYLSWHHSVHQFSHISKPSTHAIFLDKHL